MCRQGICTDQCAGVALPICPLPCSVDYLDASSKTYCPGDGFSCMHDANLVCTCDDHGTACRALPRVDPSCPFGCQPAPVNRAAAPAPIPDGGV
jgi:hypothetical protein